MRTMADGRFNDGGDRKGMGEALNRGRIFRDSQKGQEGVRSIGWEGDKAIGQLEHNEFGGEHAARLYRLPGCRTSSLQRWCLETVCCIVFQAGNSWHGM